MKSQLEKIEELIAVLPKKDKSLAKKFLEERNFMEIFELADSNIKKAQKKFLKKSDLQDDNIADLVELRDTVIDYASKIEVPYELDDIYY